MSDNKPVAWRYEDARGHYRYRGFVSGFDVEYAILKPVPLYTRAAPPAPELPALPEPWRATVDDMLTVCHMTASDDPRESVNRLINWHVSVALDPCVSSDAQALIDQGEALAADRAARPVLTDEQIDAITDQQWGKGCVPSQYKAHRAYARAVLAAAQGSKP